MPLAVLVAFLDLIPLIGLTVGGFSVFVVLLIDGGPGDAIVWLALFLVYQQLQDRVIQPLLYKGGALKVNPGGRDRRGDRGCRASPGCSARSSRSRPPPRSGSMIDELVLLRCPRHRAAEPEPAE